MRVAYGVSVLASGLAAGGVDGIGSVTRELMRYLQQAPGLELLPFEFAPQASGRVPGALGVGAHQRQALLSLLSGAPFLTTRRALQGRVDLVHATDHLVPRLPGVPVLATVMDAIPLARPEWVGYSLKSLRNRAWRESIRWADHVVTISEFSRREIVQWFGVPAERVSVIPLGVDARWFAAPAAAECERVRAHYGLEDGFFLFVGTLQPRKNLERLLAAHARLPETVRRAVPLLVVGRNGWGCEALVAQLNAGAYPDVRWLSYVPAADLHALLAMATALTFPSLYEGFGLPVLEGFAAGVPVIASAATSVPEVAGEAALLVDPEDVAGWTEAMHAVVSDAALAQRLAAAGPARARQFSWERTAQQTQALYAQLLG